MDNTDYRYDAFGEDLANTGLPVASPSSLATAYRYTGEQFDAESGLYHFRARQYDPLVGRFCGRDPFLDIPDLPHLLNRYAYAAGNPLTYRDPSGLFQITAISAAILSGTLLTLEMTLTAVAALAVVVLGVTVIDIVARNTLGRAMGTYPTESQALEVPRKAAKAGVTIDELQHAIDAAARTAADNIHAAGFDRDTLAEAYSQMPKYYVFRILTESIWRHTVNSLSKRPDWHLLYYDADPEAADARRSLALGAYPGGDPSPDEFPYASTIQGGKGAMVEYVPLKQQRRQGGQLRDFYRSRMEGQPGWFLVVPVPPQ